MAKTPQELRDAFGFLYQGEFDELNRLTWAIPEKNPLIINVGAGVGTSGSIFFSRPDVQLVTVDIEGGASPFGGLGNEKGALQEMGLLNRKRVYVPIQGSSPDIARAWKYPKASMIFIDDDHSLEGARASIGGWLPNLAEGGYIAVHDYGKIEHYKILNNLSLTADLNPAQIAEAKPYPGVDQAVGELLLGKLEFIKHVDSLVVFRNVKP